MIGDLNGARGAASRFVLVGRVVGVNASQNQTVVVVGFFVVFLTRWPNTNTYGFLASLGRPHWAGMLVRTSLSRSRSPAFHGSLPGAWRKDALMRLRGGLVVVITSLVRETLSVKRGGVRVRQVELRTLRSDV